MTKPQRRVLVDAIATILVMAIGVMMSDQVLQEINMPAGNGEFDLPSWRKVIFGVIIAFMFIGATDLAYSKDESKFQVWARITRYSNALKSGVFFRIITELA